MILVKKPCGFLLREPPKYISHIVKGLKRMENLLLENFLLIFRKMASLISSKCIEQTIFMILKAGLDRLNIKIKTGNISGSFSLG